VSEFQNILVERDGLIAVVSVNRPAKLNALDNQTIGELHAAIVALEADEGVGAIVLTGSGPKAFVAGADIEMLAKQGVLDGTANAKHGQAMMSRIETCRKPVLAAINGFALGGGLELAMACDVRYAATTAKMGLPEVSLGIIPGYGGTQRLARLVGSGAALQMILTGDHIGADEALRIGLVQAIHPPEELLAKVKEVAKKMISRGPTALAMAKEALRRGAHLPIAEGLALEADLFGMISSTAEMKEGMAAFLEKRKPSWLRG
jgi:enoyl-CoA hydratase